MTLKRSIIAGVAALGLACVASGSAFGAYEGGPPPVLTGGPNSSVIVCHPKNMGGEPGAVVYHFNSGEVTGTPGAYCCL